MRILFVEPFGRHEGHPPIESKRVTDALNEAGVHITLVTFDGIMGDWIETSRIEQHVSVVSRARFLSGLLRLIPRLRFFLLTRYLVDILETLLSVQLAFRENRRQQYDAIHFLDGQPVFLFALTSALFTRNYNLIINIYFPSLAWELRRGFKGFREGLRARDYRYCTHLVLDRLINAKVIALMQRFVYGRSLKRNKFSFICHTNEVKESYKAHLGGIFYDKIHVIPLGVKPPEPEVMSQKQARQHLHLPEEAKILLSFGTNHIGKNFNVIFQAVQDMPKTFYLVFAGKPAVGDNARNPTLLGKKYNWTENTVVVNQFIPEADKPYYFYASDAILLSYVKELVASVSVLNEACQFQLPVIASDAGQLGEYVRDYNLGLTFMPENPGSLHQAIISFLNLGEEERLAIRANFHRFASDLPWQEVASKYIVLYSGK